MGNIFLALDTDHEKLLRRLAQERYEGRKGSISRIVSEALDDLYHKQKEKNRKKEALSRLFSLSEKGINLGVKKGKKIYEKREELYAGRA